MVTTRHYFYSVVFGATAWKTQSGGDSTAGGENHLETFLYSKKNDAGLDYLGFLSQYGVLKHGLAG